MKKIISLVLCFCIFSFNASFAIETILDDEFANNTLNKNLKIEKKTYEPIIDEFVIKTLNPSLKIKYSETSLIIDDFAANIKNYEPIYYDKNQTFDFEKFELLAIKIRPIKYHTTRKNILVGDEINFKLENDFQYKNQVYKKGDILTARVENINLNKAYGVPADMIIGDFKLPSKTKLEGEITLKGANRALWVHPLAYTTTMFFGLGVFVWTVRGGHAKLSPRRTYELKFEG